MVVLIDLETFFRVEKSDSEIILWLLCYTQKMYRKVTKIYQKRYNFETKQHHNFKILYGKLITGNQILLEFQT